MKQIHNSKKRMPTILTEDLAWEWLMEKPGDERLMEIAGTQIPSRLMEFCTIDPDYRTTLEAHPKEYPELAPLDTAYLDTEELKLITGHRCCTALNYQSVFWVVVYSLSIFAEGYIINNKRSQITCN